MLVVKDPHQQNELGCIHMISRLCTSTATRKVLASGVMWCIVWDRLDAVVNRWKQHDTTIVQRARPTPETTGGPDLVVDMAQRAKDIHSLDTFFIQCNQWMALWLGIQQKPPFWAFTPAVFKTWLVQQRFYKRTTGKLGLCVWKPLSLA